MFSHWYVLSNNDNCVFAFCVFFFNLNFIIFVFVLHECQLLHVNCKLPLTLSTSTWFWYSFSVTTFCFFYFLFFILFVYLNWKKIKNSEILWNILFWGRILQNHLQKNLIYQIVKVLSIIFICFCYYHTVEWE